MSEQVSEQLDFRKYIIIKGAHLHNLKNINVAIPKNKLVVITGLSGSGKSSLAFDTLYAEGQRRYIESLSSYARQFLGKIDKPEVDMIEGIAPAIAIEQRVNNRNPRSTVGTATEIYEYIKLLFARIGNTYSPISGRIVKRHSVTDVVDYILSLKENTRLMINVPLNRKANTKLSDQLKILLQQGFSKILCNKITIEIEDIITGKEKVDPSDLLFLVIDRLVTYHDADLKNRLVDSVHTSFLEGNGICMVEEFYENNSKINEFSNKFELDGMTFVKPSENFFSFNNPYGACKTCEGFGSIIGIDEDTVIPDKTLSVYEDAVLCWRGEKMSEWKDELIKHAHKFDFPIHKPYCDLSEEQQKLLWVGNSFFGGINDFFKWVETQTYKIQYRVMLARYRGKTSCPDCKGTRLRKDAGYVKIGGSSIQKLVLTPISSILNFFQELNLNEYDRKIGERILTEIITRLKYLEDVGLGYLTLNRLSSTLSGGESQRISLANSLGSSLVGSMYILDEPTVGLHAKDVDRLLDVLKKLRDLGNTVIVVEHDETIIKAADHLIDIGPEAGRNGGQVMFSGKYNDLLQNNESLTAQYLTGLKKISLPVKRKPWKYKITVTGARENNLKSLNVTFPLNIMTVVTGVSGSGKSTLVNKTLFTGLKKIFDSISEKPGLHKKIEGDIHKIKNIEFVDQNPIGRSSRSNPVTYIKAYDDIRTLFADQPLAKNRNYKPGHFSFNVPGGRCEECEGEGVIHVSMQFMADVTLVCEHCGGKKFKEDILDIKFHHKDINEILHMTVDQAIEFFREVSEKNNTVKRLISKLQPLQDVGMGYVELGQSSSTLSGGEAQRIKLASFLSKGASEKPTLFIFDEPSTGLHFHDISKLYKAFCALIDNGHSLIIIEHNMEIIKCADWIIDLGPGGGEQGGNLVFEGTPENLIKCKESHTGKFLAEKL